MKERTNLLFWLTIALGLIAVGVLGLRLLADLPWIDALFYIVTTLATVGYEAPPYLTPEAKVFLTFYIIAAVGTVGVIVGRLVQTIVVDRMRQVLGKRRDNGLERLNDHWIVCGLGRVGLQVAEQIAAAGQSLVVIERDAERIASLPSDRWPVLVGDATGEEILAKAGIHRARGLVAALSADADNVYVTLSAKALKADLRIVVRASDAQAVNALYRAGADKVINPVRAGAVALARAALSPAVADFFELINLSRELDLDFESFRVVDGSSLEGLALKEAPLRSRYNAIVVAIHGVDGSVAYNPSGEKRIEGGDELILLAPRTAMAALRRDFLLPRSDPSTT
ncbi:potassium channel protein [Aminithiophilus ramosus]|uniref:Potassium channel protein n=2 Tax=Synergistales TaxID=649776 RepID=A0A9Q7A7T5_9BACT|nr:potassium channel protein [Aminithiophilus ramosus]QTX32340.1 potassium channel protein [Aminithiophilus ramosus]QVL36215.1 potassium channel protein [Synergistota bacterium]